MSLLDLQALIDKGYRFSLTDDAHVETLDVEEYLRNEDKTDVPNGNLC